MDNKLYITLDKCCTAVANKCSKYIHMIQEQCIYFLIDPSTTSDANESHQGESTTLFQLVQVVVTLNLDSNRPQGTVEAITEEKCLAREPWGLVVYLLITVLARTAEHYSKH